MTTLQHVPQYEQPLIEGKQTSKYWYFFFQSLYNAVASAVGTVTSIGLASTDLTVSGTPVTTSGNITANLVTQAGLTAGSYTLSSITVNGKGIITAASSAAPYETRVEEALPRAGGADFASDRVHTGRRSSDRAGKQPASDAPLVEQRRVLME